VALLRGRAQEVIADPWHDIFVSAITGWEVATKRIRGTMAAPSNLASEIETKGFLELPLTCRHAERVAALPSHHRDPFDRFLVAQAQIEGLTLVTRDQRIREYEIEILEA